MGGSPPAAVRALVERTLAHPSLAGLSVTLLDGVDDVPSAMAGADLALSASGSTCWELCALALPSVLVAVAENQEPLARAMASHGAAAHPGSLAGLTPSLLAAAVADLARDPGRRATMARQGRALVDGRGSRRVVTRMRSAMLSLRSATEADARLLWEWANDPVVRKASFRTETIDWDTHVRWFATRLADPGTHLYLAEASDSTVVGQVRFQGDDESAVLSDSVPAGVRGRGWGPALIDAGVRRLFRETRVVTAVARIKPENACSRSAFEDAAFTLEPDSTVSGPRCLRYARHRHG